jgi:23S rRNA pseudouridine1911/1915/1917 synthase
VQDGERDRLREPPGIGAVAEDQDELAAGGARGAFEEGAAAHAHEAAGDEAADLPDGDPEAGGEEELEADAGVGGGDAPRQPDGRPATIEVHFVVEEDFHGYRLDLYLKRKIPRLSRTRLQEIIRTQLEGPGGRAMKPHSPVSAGDRLLIRRPARPEPPCPRTFGVLLEDPDFLVIDKPAGLPVHASARYYFNTLTRVLAERYPGQGLQIAHRLDRETSGCLVVARGKEAAARLKSAFERRRVGKTYLALVHGDPPWADGAEAVIDLPLALADPARSRLRIRMEPAEGRPDAQEAITRVRVVERHPGCAMVACRPVTGRQHQIRAHLAAVGHPIVGDRLYAHGDEAFARICDLEATGVAPEGLEEEFGMARQALHAAGITFPHPRTGEPVTVQAPLPADMRAYVARIGAPGRREP